ncbi:carbamoyltransferase HypF [Roseomonas sp. HF4]|uniref:carbamoyltransferase HypF n=1 Tax=Roseomonas sp. HF4 TaxID=2562313 RepID=UPI0010C11491|nr:carbamoyltransferase HypF [Roseomonas sp. HF4]
MTRAISVRVRGVVQGVGFRPAVWQAATALGLDGDVRNDAEGVLIHAAGPPRALQALVARLRAAPPPLARVAAIEVSAWAGSSGANGFAILGSGAGAARTAAAPDAATCDACAAEIDDPAARRHRYPFTTCTHCGPRFTILECLPFDRARTTMARFPLCTTCTVEFGSPADRRFHAEAIACPGCGPRLHFGALEGEAALEAAIALIAGGGILALKGIGGYQLACDAEDGAAVATLRARKRRRTKPFALMARDLDAVRALCHVSAAEAKLLASPEAPIVLLRARRVPEGVAPGLDTLGVMLPTTPLHRLLLAPFATALVMTSGNLSDAPPETDDADARTRLAGIADGFLSHNRPIASRMDDSVARVLGGRTRLLRRARGYAPAPMALPPGFAPAPPILATGGQQKATFCLLREGEAVLSHHIGDLDEVATSDDFAAALDHYAGLFRHRAAHVAVDLHPGYVAAALGREIAARQGATLHPVQHHHAHVAACLAENGAPRDAPPVLGVVLDGLGLGEDGALWGNELLLCDYRAARRVGTLLPTALPGGDAAAREPWRNLFAQLDCAFGWAEVVARHGGLPIVARLRGKPVASLAAMIRHGVNAPPASSCGRLFDAVAAALGIGFDRVGHEGEAAMRLEEIAARRDVASPYPFAIGAAGDIPALDPAPMWAALLADLARGTAPALVASRFHRGLATAIVELGLAVAPQAGSVALSGGCLQNAVLHRWLEAGFRARGRRVLTHSLVPANDGGLAFGQAVIVAARLAS